MVTFCLYIEHSFRKTKPKSWEMTEFGTALPDHQSQSKYYLSEWFSYIFQIWDTVRFKNQRINHLRLQWNVLNKVWLGIIIKITTLADFFKIFITEGQRFFIALCIRVKYFDSNKCSLIFHTTMIAAASSAVLLCEYLYKSKTTIRRYAAASPKGPCKQTNIFNRK